MRGVRQIRRGRIAGAAVAIALMFGAAFARADWVATDEDAPVGSPYTLVVTRQWDGGFEAELRVAGFDIDRVDSYDDIAIPGAASVGEIGRPALPSVRRWIQLPAQSAAHVRVLERREVARPGAWPRPQQPLVTDLDPPAAFAFDPAAYAASGLFPTKSARVGRPAIWGGVRVAPLVLNPVRWDASSGELRVASLLRVRVTFDGDDPTNALASDAAIDPARVAMLSGTLLNVIASGPPPAAPRAAAVRTLILYDDDLSGAMASIDDLADAHEADGPVSIVPIADDTTSQQIYDLIDDAYRAADPPELRTVLLLGDVGPTGITLRTGTQGRAGDAPYTFLDGDDLLSDIAIGRLPAQDADELTVMIDKTLAWLNGEVSGDWMTRALLIAHQQGYPDKYTAASEEIRLYPYALPAPEFVKLYGGEGANNAALMAELDAGALIVNYRGHGIDDAWLTWSALHEDFDTDDAAGIAAPDRPGIVFSVACDNADLTNSLPSLGEAWMRNPDAAAAFLGSLYASYTIPNHEFNKFLFRALYDDGVTDLGSILNKANADVLAFFEGDDTYASYTQKNVEMYVWLGDPDIALPISGILGPGSLRGEASSTSHVTLLWLDRSDNEDEFDLEEGDSATGPWSPLATLAPDTTEYEIDGFTEAEGRYYRVRAVAGGEPSLYSNVAYAQSLPAAPDGVAAEPLSTSSARVTWQDHSSGEIGYRVLRRAEGDADFVAVHTTNEDAVDWTDAGLIEGTNYEYAVEAFTTGGAAPAPESAFALTLPAAPSDLSATVEDGVVVVGWTDRSNGEDGYHVYRKVPGDNDWTAVGDAIADAVTFEDAPPVAGEQYLYTVASTNASGQSLAAEVASVVAGPGEPAGPSAQAISPNEIRVTWPDESDVETAWRLNRSLNGADPADLADLPADTTQFTDASLSEGARAAYRVTALMGSAASAPSAAVEARTPPNTPTDLTATDDGDHVVLAWSDRSGVETGYAVERLDGNAWTRVAELPANVETYTDDESGGAMYRVLAFHEDGESAPSNEASSEIDDPDDRPMDGGGDDDDGGSCGC